MGRRPRPSKSPFSRATTTRRPAKAKKNAEGGKKPGTGFWGILGGIAAAVLAAVITGWLTKFGLIPKSDDKPPTSTPSPSRTPAAAQNPEAAPFTVSVEDNPTDCTSWIANRAPEELREIPFGDLRSWIGMNGGGMPGDPVEFTVQGTTAAAVTLLDMRVKVVSRNPVKPTRTIVQMQCNGGGEVFRWIAVDLDEQPPRLKAEVADRELLELAPISERKPVRFPYKVSLSEPESFVVSPRTVECDCTWEIHLGWTSQGKRGTFKIDNKGKPFRTITDKGAGWRCSTYARLKCDTRKPGEKP